MTVMRSGIAGALAAVALVAGCKTTVVEPPLPAKTEVKVVETDNARAIDDVAAKRLKLEARFREGMENYNAGRVDVAAAILQEVARQIDNEGVQLTPASQSKMKAVLAGTYKPPRKEPKPVVLPAREYGPSTPVSPKKDGVASGTPAPTPAPYPELRLPALTDPAIADQLVTVDFNQVDLRIFIKTISELTGLNFLLDDNVKGTVTLISPTKVRLGEVYKVLENVLDVKGFAAVPAGNVIKIVPRSEAARKTPVTRVGNDPATMPREDTIVTQIIPLRYAAASDIVSLVSPLVAAGDQVAPYAQTNALVVTGSSANIRRMAEIIQSVDVPAAQEEVSVIPLKHANCTEVAQQIQQIMEKDATASRASESPTPRGVAIAAGAAALSAKSSFKILSDTRTNSLVVLANSRMTQSIRDLVAQLDVQRAIDAGNIHVVYLENAEAKDVAKSLTAALEASAKSAGGQKTDIVKVTADESTNSLIIIASPEDFRVTADIIAKLDIAREQVLVEMKIIEVDEEVLRQIGAEWASLDQASSDGLRGFSGTNFGLRSQAAAGTLDGMGVGAFKLVNGTTQIAAVLQMFEKNSKANILSTPQILTSNHREAQITVAENIPYVKESRVSEVEPSAPTVIKTYDYRDVGVILKLTPHISQGGAVRLVLDMTFSKQLPSANADTPTTAKRQAQTVITVQDGKTIVIGGLIRDDKQVVVKKVPFFGDIPYLGFFFQYKETQTTKTNLFIFMTPHVLAGKTTAEAAAADEKTPTPETAPAPEATPAPEKTAGPEKTAQ